MLWLALSALLTACSGGAVVFAPAAPPPDVSPAPYSHPSGTFSLLAPRSWALYEQNTTTLAAAAFTPPGETEPVLVVAAVNLGADLDPARINELLNLYQQEIRPDHAYYKQESREAMGDGSWRMTGLRQYPGGITRQVNTFFDWQGSLVIVSEVLLPLADTPAAQAAARIAELQRALNSVIAGTGSSLQPAPLSTFEFVARSGVEIEHVSAWRTPEGIFYITGELHNTGTVLLVDVPVRAVLQTADGLPVAEALDVAMLRAIPPGSYAPFSLRFGAGQPALTTGYVLEVGSVPVPQDGVVFIGDEALDVRDELVFTPEGALVISGTVTNTGTQTARDLRAVVTLFDEARLVTAAAFAEVNPPVLAAGETGSYSFILREYGSSPANYVVSVQGTP